MQINRLKYRCFILLLLSFHLQQIAIGQVLIFDTDFVPPQTPGSLDIYLVIGQSNMSGRAPIRKEDSAVIDRAFLYTGGRFTFNEMILKLPGFMDHTAVAISQVTLAQDGTHFDTQSAILMGERYAGEMKRILNSLEKTANNKKQFMTPGMITLSWQSGIQNQDYS